MTRYCKECGHPVGFSYGETLGHCPYCDKMLTLKETIADHTLDARMTQLKAMHDLISECNDENLYMSWIVNGVPDGADMDDIKGIALDDEIYNECWDLFIKLVAKDGMRW